MEKRSCKTCKYHPLCTKTTAEMTGEEKDRLNNCFSLSEWAAKPIKTKDEIIAELTAKVTAQEEELKKLHKHLLKIGDCDSCVHEDAEWGDDDDDGESSPCGTCNGSGDPNSKYVPDLS